MSPCLLVPQRRLDSPHTPAPPLVLIETIASRQLVTIACERARSAGVRAGMTLAQARAICPGLTHADHDPASDMKALEALSRWLIRFSPVVSPEPPNAVFLDVTGSERLFRGLDRLAQEVTAAMERLRIVAAVAIAPTPGAAWALAAASKPGLSFNVGCSMLDVQCSAREETSNIQHATSNVQQASIRDAVSSLPPWSLRIDPATQAMLHHLGIETVGQLLALPRDALATRFGSGLLRRIDQALGHAPEMLVPLVPRPMIRARMEFDGTVDSIEAIWLVFKELIGQILVPLTRRGCGARRIDVDFKQALAGSIRKTVLLSRPSRDPSNLFNLLRCATEGVRSDDGFTAIALSVSVAERLTEEQSLLVDGEQQAAEGELAHLIERLMARMGQNAIARAELHASHLPEKAWKNKDEGGRMKDEKTGRDARLSFHSSPRNKDEKAGRSGASPSFHPSSFLLHPYVHPYVPPRPLHLLAMPREIRVTAGPSHDGEGPPITFTDGRALHRLTHTAGPERICGVWWEGRDKTRDYYEVEDDTQRRFWLFRVIQTGKWFLHGEFE